MTPDPEQLLRRVRNRLFLKEYDPRTGEYRGEDPPSKEEQTSLSNSSEAWCDEWVDKTGEFYKIEDGLMKRVPCVCGEKTGCGPRARFTRCSNCNRVLIDMEWEDDRYEKKDPEVMSLSDFQ